MKKLCDAVSKRMKTTCDYPHYTFFATHELVVSSSASCHHTSLNGAAVRYLVIHAANKRSRASFQPSCLLLWGAAFEQRKVALNTLERIGGKPDDVSSSPRGRTVSRCLPFFWKNISSEYACTGRQPHIHSSLKLPEILAAGRRGGGSSTPLSTPSNNRARSERNPNAYCSLFNEFA
ncbi:hypothetical protein T07_10354 [Trichinella nelsoni]|uniref:Uncharacterized protein n=1 Tax=Trichinella nelsoni TaxID=6336 RepID=A0A0V0RFZ5_9BILA|nr:hypothetical protein T07_10354 [Trichinella nelsoni]